MSIARPIHAAKKQVAIIGGGTGGRLLAHALRKKCNVTLISKFKYTLDDYYKISNACLFPRIRESNVSNFSGSYLDLIIDNVNDIQKIDNGFELTLDSRGTKKFDEVVIGTGNSVREEYEGQLMRLFEDIDINLYSTCTSVQAMKTRFKLYESKPGTIVFYSSGANGKNLFHALSACFTFENEIRKRGRAIRNLYDIKFVTSDPVVFPYDVQVSFALKEEMRKRGISFTEGYKIGDLSVEDSTVQLVNNKDESKRITETYSSMFMDPEIELNELFTKVCEFDPSTFTTEDGVLAIGKVMTKKLGIVEIGAIRNQAQYVSNKILGIPQEPNFDNSSDINIFLGDQHFFKISLDNNRRVTAFKKSSYLDKIRKMATLKIRGDFMRYSESSPLLNPLR